MTATAIFEPGRMLRRVWPPVFSLNISVESSYGLSERFRQRPVGHGGHDRQLLIGHFDHLAGEGAH